MLLLRQLLPQIGPEGITAAYCCPGGIWLNLAASSRSKIGTAAAAAAAPGIPSYFIGISHSAGASTVSDASAASSAAEPGSSTSVSSSEGVSSISESQQQPALVEQYLSPLNMSRREQLNQRKQDVIRRYQRADGDVGSPEVQIALLTEKIRDLQAHFNVHKKDNHSMRGLTGILNQRRKLLSYLRRSNFERYAFMLHSLGLKDTYAKQARYDKYRVGTRLGTPAELLKRYGNH